MYFQFISKHICWLCIWFKYKLKHVLLLLPFLQKTESKYMGIGFYFFSVSVWAIYHPSLTQGHMRLYGRSQPVAQWFHKQTHAQKPTDLETESVDSVKMWTLNSLNCCLFMLEYFWIICGRKMYPFNRVHKLAGFMGQATLNKTQFVVPDK